VAILSDDFVSSKSGQRGHEILGQIQEKRTVFGWLFEQNFKVDFWYLHGYHKSVKIFLNSPQNLS
jgi:hypothetical protein